MCPPYARLHFHAEEEDEEGDLLNLICRCADGRLTTETRAEFSPKEEEEDEGFLFRPRGGHSYFILRLQQIGRFLILILLLPFVVKEFLSHSSMPCADCTYSNLLVTILSMFLFGNCTHTTQYACQVLSDDLP